MQLLNEFHKIRMYTDFINFFKETYSEMLSYVNIYHNSIIIIAISEAMSVYEHNMIVKNSFYRHAVS